MVASEGERKAWKVAVVREGGGERQRMAVVPRLFLHPGHIPQLLPPSYGTASACIADLNGFLFLPDL